MLGAALKLHTALWRRSGAPERGAGVRTPNWRSTPRHDRGEEGQNAAGAPGRAQLAFDYRDTAENERQNAPGRAAAQLAFDYRDTAENERQNAPGRAA
ncbi:MAG TPA: hypothetical protein VFS16_05885, partial [Acidimicrobiia bacterium]|nr:hypothetical protein [Acidimicrobiia bacterium]